MTRNWIFLACSAGVLMLSACANDGGGDSAAAPGNQEFVAFTRALAATAPEDAEPVVVEAIAVDAPEDQEPEDV